MPTFSTDVDRDDADEAMRIVHRLAMLVCYQIDSCGIGAHCDEKYTTAMSYLEMLEFTNRFFTNCIINPIIVKLVKLPAKIRATIAPFECDRLDTLEKDIKLLLDLFHSEDSQRISALWTKLNNPSLRLTENLADEESDVMDACRAYVRLTTIMVDVLVWCIRESLKRCALLDLELSDEISQIEFPLSVHHSISMAMKSQYDLAASYRQCEDEEDDVPVKDKW